MSYIHEGNTENLVNATSNVLAFDAAFVHAFALSEEITEPLTGAQNQATKIINELRFK